MSHKIDHIIVLMLENRSFDHMLGYLDHPNPEYPGLTGNESNPWESGQQDVPVSDRAAETIITSPNHTHEAMVRHLYDTRLHEEFDYEQSMNNLGFVQEFEEYVLDEEKKAGQGPEVMKCFRPEKIPVLSTLAKEFAVCTRWFCSVPGMTWPNRSYLHAGTSEGQVDIKLRPYHAKTVFELLGEHGLDWCIYHDGLSHAMLYTHLQEDDNRYNFRKVRKLFGDIRRSKLPAYCFIEPDHFGIDSTSQHPGNNTDKKGKRDFLEAEKLIADIYNALKANPGLFNKTLFVITYDESGGFFDREVPPRDSIVVAPDHHVYKKTGFRFNVLGPRVPAVLVSPWIARHRIDDTLYDHTSVIRSVCEQFLPAGTWLRDRDRVANSFLHNLDLDEPRTDLPQVMARDDYDPELVWDDDEEFDDMQNGLIDMGFAVDEQVKGHDLHEDEDQWQEAASSHRRLFNSARELVDETRRIVDRFQRADDEVVEEPADDTVD